MKRQVLTLLLVVSAAAIAPFAATAAPITPGTAFIDPDIITASDTSTFVGLSFVGTGNVLMFDRRIDAFATFNAFLFDAAFSDGLTAQIQVNPEFRSVAAAQEQAEKYGSVIGQLPTALRADMDTGLDPQGTLSVRRREQQHSDPYGSGRRLCVFRPS